jgi:flagellar basal-body rod modification protein FlgD
VVVNAVTGIGLGGATAPKGVAPKPDGLGKDDFLKMLLAQLRNQDPLDPQSNPEFMGTMAQFTSLEQMTNLVGQFERMAWSGQVSQSVSLIGKLVTWEEADGTAASGVVTSVAFDEGEIEISVGDRLVDPQQIRSVS